MQVVQVVDLGELSLDAVGVRQLLDQHLDVVCPGRQPARPRHLLDTGVRVSEPCGPEITEEDLERELASVTGKGVVSPGHARRLRR